MTDYTPKSFADKLRQLAGSEEEKMHQGLKIVANLITETAKEEIGTYQNAAGKFPAWAPLAESTEREKLRLGYNANEPLLRTGALRDSITNKVERLTAIIGSTSPIMLYHEYGTVRMPARPVIGLAAYKNKKNIRAILSRELAASIAPNSTFKPSFSYSGGETYSFAGVFKY